MTDQSFDENMRRIQEKDKNGLKEIYEAYITFIYAVVYDIVKNKEEAEDIASEFFIRLWNIADTYRFGGKHRAWMAAIAHNLTIDYLRKNRKEQAVDEIVEPEQEPVSHVEMKVVEELSMRQAFRLLDPTEQEILNMKIIGELTFREIAEILKKPMGTITWKYQKAIQKLRRCGAYAE